MKSLKTVRLGTFPVDRVTKLNSHRDNKIKHKKLASNNYKIFLINFQQFFLM